MGAVALPDTTIDPSSDLGRQLVVDLARYRENLLDEKTIRKRYRFDESTWQKLGDDDELIRKVEEESVRRIRDGSTKREKSQQLITKGPDILDSIASDASASPRYRVDALKVLDGMASTGGEAAAGQSDRFIITINLPGDGVDHVLHFDKSIKPDAFDVDPYNDVDTDVTATPWGMVAAISTKKKDSDDGGQGHI